MVFPGPYQSSLWKWIQTSLSVTFLLEEGGGASKPEADYPRALMMQKSISEWFDINF